MAPDHAALEGANIMTAVCRGTRPLASPGHTPIQMSIVKRLNSLRPSKTISSGDHYSFACQPSRAVAEKIADWRDSPLIRNDKVKVTRRDQVKVTHPG